jgi:hypothetical protein
MRIQQFAGCSSLRLMGEPDFFSSLIGSDFVVYRSERILIFDILVSDFESAAVVKTLACQATGRISEMG